MATIAVVPHAAPVAAALAPRGPAAAATPSAAPVGAVVATVSSAIDIAVTAGVALGGHRVVCLDADGTASLASSDDIGCTHLLGLTLGAAQAGAPLRVRRLGQVDDPSFAFAIGPVWLGLAGALTQARPSAGILAQVGYALGPTRLLVHPRPATILASS